MLGGCASRSRATAPRCAHRQWQQQAHASSSSSSSATVACTLTLSPAQALKPLTPQMKATADAANTCLHTRAVPTCCVPAGEGTLKVVDSFRLRLACAADVNGSVSTLRTAPRPAAFPGTQAVSLQDAQYKGKTYPDSVLADNVAVFVSPGDVEDAAYSAGACAGSADVRSSSRPGCWRFGQAVRGYYMRRGGHNKDHAAGCLWGRWQVCPELPSHGACTTGGRVCAVCVPGCRVQCRAGEHHPPVRNIHPSWLQRAVHCCNGGRDACRKGGGQQSQSESAARGNCCACGRRASR